MFFSRQWQEFLMPELHLLVLWHVRHVVNYGYFLLRDFIHLPHKIDYFPAVAPRLGLMSQARLPKMNHAPVLIPLFRNSVKIRVPLELLVVVINERPDSCRDLDVLPHGLEVAVLHLCDLRTDEPHFGLTLCDLRIQHTVIVTLDARRNDIYHQPDQSGGYDNEKQRSLSMLPIIFGEIHRHIRVVSAPGRPLVEPLRYRIATSIV